MTREELDRSFDELYQDCVDNLGELDKAFLYLQKMRDKYRTDCRPAPQTDGEPLDYPRRSVEFEEKLRSAINQLSIENQSDTPDFILSDMLSGFLDVYAATVKKRDEWYGKEGAIAARNTTPRVGDAVPLKKWTSADGTPPDGLYLDILSPSGTVYRVETFDSKAQQIEFNDRKYGLIPITLDAYWENRKTLYGPIPEPQDAGGGE